MAPYLLFLTGFFTGGSTFGGVDGADIPSGGVAVVAPGWVEVEVGSSVFRPAGVFGQVGSSD